MRCLVVGIGHVALERYLPALAAEPDVDLACWSRNVESAQLGADRFGGVALADLDGVAAWRPDVAFVVTPDTEHVQVVQDLIDLGVPRIRVEKPLAAAGGQTRITARDLADGDRLARAARARGIELAVGYNYRHFATVARARVEVARRGWSPASGAAAATHYACLSHVIDLLGVFLGDIRELTALAGDEHHGEPKFFAEDRVIAFTFVSGATGVLRVSSAEPRSDHLFELSIRYPEGSVRLVDLDGELELFDARQSHRMLLQRPDEHSRGDGYEASFGESIRAYLTTVRAGQQPPATGEDGVHELLFHAAVERSLSTRGPVVLASVAAELD